MKINTARYGEIDIDPARIISVNEGIIGFPAYRRYIFLPFLEGSPFELFQALDQSDLAFVVMNPFAFKADYQFDLGDQDIADLQVVNKEEIQIRVIVTIPADPREMTANLQAPLIINEPRLLAKQIILHDDEYTTKHKIFMGGQPVI